ncbi:MAG TPA: glycosyltransferase family 4 protein [Thermomicrobiales bacterium]|nr:glycosyltransferase family 4 protein [Thermomicrobiales bacterium]
MKVLLLHKALVNGLYQKKAEALAALPGVDLTVVVPPAWREARWGTVPLERRHTAGYRLEVAPIAFNGHHHVHFYRSLGALVRRVRPDVFHVDEEPFNLATAQAFYWARRVGARPLFVTWATVYRDYPPPFSLFERYTHRHAAGAIAGNTDALDVLRRRGYAGPVEIVPLALDPDLYPPREGPRGDPFTIGFLGRLVPEKGAQVLLDAAARLRGDWRVLLIGGGGQEGELRAQAARLGLADQVEIVPMVPAAEVPAWLHRLDVLAVPSLTTPTWKEQFGRVIIEAMAAAVPVVGSDSGEIPRVIADAGLVVPEGDAAALAGALQALHDDEDRRRALACAGRRRVLAHYTWERVARQYHALYEAMLGRGA